MDSKWKTRMAPPLALLVLSALTPKHHELTMVDENVRENGFDDAPDLVGITVKVDTFCRSAEIAEKYRSRGIPVVVGGVHATAVPEQCAKIADAVVIGEGEVLWPQLLRDFENGIPLKQYYQNEKPVDIASVPIPDWSLLNENDYLFTNTLRIGRGCPWTCDFCYNSCKNMNSSYRAKPLRNILAEIKSLNTNHVMFIDDNFIGNLKNCREILREFKKLNLTWHTAVSANIGQYEDILDDMAESGCRTLFIGFETINRRNLAACSKRQNKIESYNDTVKKIHDRKMMVNASFAFGFDGDDKNVFPDTLKWLEENKIETMTGHILTPYPGTVLYERWLKEGRIVDHDLTHYNTASVVFKPTGMTADELREGYQWIYSQFYSWKSILKRMPEAKEQRIAYLEFALLYRKFGKLTSWVGEKLGMRRMAKLATFLAYHPKTALKTENTQGILSEIF
jgi:radical SAM superfamily enzyme YgiQ (UPF0313 family)